MRKVWYHKILIQNYFGFILSDLIIIHWYHVYGDELIELFSLNFGFTQKRIAHSFTSYLFKKGGWGRLSPLVSQFRRPWLHSIIQGGLQFDQCRSNEIFIFHAPEDYTQKLHVNACCCGLGIYGKIYILLHSGLNSAWQL